MTDGCDVTIFEFEKNLFHAAGRPIFFIMLGYAIRALVNAINTFNFCNILNSKQSFIIVGPKNLALSGSYKSCDDVTINTEVTGGYARQPINKR